MLIDDWENPCDEIDIPWHKEGINAIIRVLLRHGLDIQFKINDGSRKPSKIIYCNIRRIDSYFATLSIEVSADYVHIVVKSRNNTFTKSWNKKKKYRDRDFYTSRKIWRVRTRERRPKFKKFAAYFVKRLLEFDGKRYVKRVMES